MQYACLYTLVWAMDCTGLNGISNMDTSMRLWCAGTGKLFQLHKLCLEINLGYCVAWMLYGHPKAIWILSIAVCDISYECAHWSVGMYLIFYECDYAAVWPEPKLYILHWYFSSFTYIIYFLVYKKYVAAYSVSDSQWTHRKVGMY